MILEVIIYIMILVWAWLIWEWMGTPLMPDDFDIDNEHIKNELNNKKGKKNGST